MSKPTKDMTNAGKIRSLRMALRKAEHPKVDEYEGMYLLYVADFYGDINKAVKGLQKIDS